jgi:hypothetical protein
MRAEGGGNMGTIAYEDEAWRAYNDLGEDEISRCQTKLELNALIKRKWIPDARTANSLFSGVATAMEKLKLWKQPEVKAPMDMEGIRVEGKLKVDSTPAPVTAKAVKSTSWIMDDAALNQRVNSQNMVLLDPRTGMARATNASKSHNNLKRIVTRKGKVLTRRQYESSLLNLRKAMAAKQNRVRPEKTRKHRAK